MLEAANNEGMNKKFIDQLMMKSDKSDEYSSIGSRDMDSPVREPAPQRRLLKNNSSLKTLQDSTLQPSE